MAIKTKQEKIETMYRMESELCWQTKAQAIHKGI